MKQERKTHVVSAAGKPLGKLAVEVANLLRGKRKADFAPYKDVGDFVTVQNFKEVRVTGKKPTQKRYFRHSGYIGNLKSQTLGELMEKKPLEVLRKAVLGMMPSNKLRSQQIKRLKVEL